MKRKLQVFVSSTFEDLKDERQKVIEAILQARHIPAGMELFTASNESQLVTVKKWIDESDLYVLLLGGRYGSIEQQSGKSYTHIEYEHAEKSIPIITIVLDDEFINNKVKEHGVSMIEQNNRAHYELFKQQVMSRMCSIVKTLDEIGPAVFKAIMFAEQNVKESAGWLPVAEFSLDSKFNDLERMNAALQEECTLQAKKLQKYERLIRKIDSTKLKEEEINHRNNPVYKMIDRFIELHVKHGIQLTELPQFYDGLVQITLSDLKSDDDIMSILTDNLLDKTADIFSIEKDWLICKSEKMYNPPNYYKQVSSAIDLLANLSNNYDVEANFFRKVNHLDNTSEKDQYIILILKVWIERNKITSHKYIPIRPSWNWGYWRTRYQLKSLIRIIGQLGIEINGYTLNSTSFNKLEYYSNFIDDVIESGNKHLTWYPDDFMDGSWSVQAKELDERPKILNYIHDQRYDRALMRSIYKIEQLDGLNKYEICKLKKSFESLFSPEELSEIRSSISLL